MMELATLDQEYREKSFCVLVDLEEEEYVNAK